MPTCNMKVVLHHVAAAMPSELSQISLKLSDACCSKPFSSTSGSASLSSVGLLRLLISADNVFVPLFEFCQVCVGGPFSCTSGSLRLLISGDNVFFLPFEFCQVCVGGLPVVNLALLTLSLSKLPIGCALFTTGDGVKFSIRRKMESDFLAFWGVRGEGQGCEGEGETCAGGGAGLPASLNPSCFSTGRPLSDIRRAWCFATAAESSIADCLCPPR